MNTSSQTTRQQKLNSYWIMNSLGDNICPPAVLSELIVDKKIYLVFLTISDMYIQI